MILVTGKGGRKRVVPFSPKTGQALSRYLRVRGRQPNAGYIEELWLADRGRGALKPNGIKVMFKRRGKAAGVNEAIGRNLHAHLGRHYVAHHAQNEGMSEGDLMLLMGWSSVEMARRYGRSAATDRAHKVARKMRLGDRL